ncbi:MAG TPA: hypothetical protein VFF49_04590 [Thermodesulfobacteriota bacterium]|nr:hypothetical protein [Thermodesulfobacteriota bacterium]
MDTQEFKKRVLRDNVFPFLILFFLLTSIAAGEDYIAQLKNLVVSKVSDEQFQIKGEIVNNTDMELKRFSIKCIIFNPSGEVVEENQILPFVIPIPPRGSSPFLLPIRYKPDMEKFSLQVINLVGKELSVDTGGKPLEFSVPR